MLWISTLLITAYATSLDSSLEARPTCDHCMRKCEHDVSRNLNTTLRSAVNHFLTDDQIVLMIAEVENTDRSFRRSIIESFKKCKGECMDVFCGMLSPSPIVTPELLTPMPSPSPAATTSDFFIKMQKLGKGSLLDFWVLGSDVVDTKTHPQESSNDDGGPIHLLASDKLVIIQPDNSCECVAILLVFCVLLSCFVAKSRPPEDVVVVAEPVKTSPV